MRKKNKPTTNDKAQSVESLESMPKDVRNKGTVSSTLHNDKKPTKEELQEQREVSDLLPEMNVQVYTAQVPVTEVDSQGIVHFDKEGSKIQYIEKELTLEDFVKSASLSATTTSLVKDARELDKVNQALFAPHLMAMFALAFKLESRDDNVMYDGELQFLGIQQFDISVCRLMTLINRENKAIKRSDQFKKGEIILLEIPDSFHTMRSTLRNALLFVCRGKADHNGVTCDPDIFQTYNDMRKQKHVLGNRDEDDTPITISEATSDLKKSIKDFKATCKASEYKDLKAVKDVVPNVLESTCINAVNDLTNKNREETQALTLACNLELNSNKAKAEKEKPLGIRDDVQTKVDLPTGKIATVQYYHSGAVLEQFPDIFPLSFEGDFFMRQKSFNLSN